MNHEGFLNMSISQRRVRAEKIEYVFHDELDSILSTTILANIIPFYQPICLLLITKTLGERKL